MAADLHLCRVNMDPGTRICVGLGRSVCKAFAVHFLPSVQIILSLVDAIH